MSKKGLYGYLVSEGLLLCLIEVGKVCGWSVQAVRILMYTAILINTIIVGYCFCHSGTNRTKSSDRLVAYAIFTTAAADFFMTLIGVERGFLPGIILFCSVQIIYALYLRLTIKVLLIRIAFFAAGLMALNMAGMLSLSNALGFLDLTLLLVNAVIAWMPVGTKTSLLFRIGITLFLCCDLSITCRDLMIGDMHAMIDFLVWIFYIPSQVAITLSYLYSEHQQPLAY